MSAPALIGGGLFIRADTIIAVEKISTPGTLDLDGILTEGRFYLSIQAHAPGMLKPEFHLLKCKDAAEQDLQFRAVINMMTVKHERRAKV